MVTNKMKKGDWFMFFGNVYKIHEITESSIQAHHMLYFHDYVEGDIYRFTKSVIENCAMEFIPYEEEKADEEETI